MLYPVPVLVPTISGRTDALLYSAPATETGVVLIETPAGGSLVEGIYDEVALYMRAAGSSVIRLTASGGTSVTEYAANVLGCVAFLRSLAAQDVVLIAHAAYGAPTTGGAYEDAVDLAYAGFLDLLAARTTTPELYAQRLAELVDTIRADIDSVVGVARLLPRSAARADRPLALARKLSPSEQLPRHEHDDSCPVVSVIVPPDGAHSLECIAPLYSWTLAQFARRHGELAHDAASAGNGETSVASGATGERRGRQLSEMIWGQLEPAWRSVLSGLATRDPMGARYVAELEPQRDGAHSRAQDYGRAWTHLDRQARAEWLSACARVFPLRRLDSPAG